MKACLVENSMDDIGQLSEQFGEDHGPDECFLLEMDEDGFPLDPGQFGEDHEVTHQSQDQRIFDVLKHCFTQGCCPRDRAFVLPHNQRKMRDFLRLCFKEGHPPKPLMTILDFDLNIELNAESTQVRECLQKIKKQTSNQFWSNVMNDTQYTIMFSIGFNHHNYNFLLWFMDAYQRDKVVWYHTKAKAMQRVLDIKSWVHDNEVIKKHLAPKGITPEFLSNAVRGNMRHFRNTLIMNTSAKIYDDISMVSRYIICFTEFIQLYLLKEKKATMPFQVDCVIAVKGCKRYIHTLCEDTNERKEHEDAEFEDADCIGNVVEKLCAENCIYVADRVEHVEQVSLRMKTMFEEFHRILIETKNCDDIYPENRRFCFFVDRRGDGNSDELIVYSPPDDVNIIPEDHIPQSMFVMSGACLIPHKGYAESKQDDFEFDPRQQEEANFTIDTQSNSRGQVLTFSFHVESADEVRCYLNWYGQSLRFYPQDIVDVLPVIFDERFSAKNVEFKDSDKAKRMVNGVLIRDKFFEHFYRHLTGKRLRDFPSQQYKDFPWVDGKQLVMGYLRLAIEYRIKIDVINDVIIAYYC